MKFLTSGFVASLLLTTGAQAQVSPAPAQAMTVAPVADNVLRTGTEVQLKLSEPLSTKGKKLRVGQHFQLSVMEAVSVGGNIVIPVGSPAVGEITEVRNKGMWGKSGHLTASLLHVSVNGRQIRLNGTFDDKGVTGTAGVVAAVAFVPVVGFFTTGTSAQIDAGTQIKGFVGEDVPLVFAAAQSVKPLEVPVAVPAAQVAAPPAATPTSGSAPNQN